MVKSDQNILRRWGVWILIAIYLILLLPITPLLSTYHDDERYYTDAAIIMTQSGDYITPYYPNGEIRSKKPIIIYWLLSASYMLFGVNFFASRLPFLLAGCLTLLITYRLALSLFKNEVEALGAAAIMAGNITLFTSSLRSTPDVLLCLFINISLYGFGSIILEGKRNLLPYCYAYLGAALAVETKGLQGLAPVAFAVFFCFVRRGAGARIRDLIHIKVMAVAVVVALWWYAAILIKHGEAGLAGFVTDQVGMRFSGSKLYVLENIGSYFWGFARHFFPWSLVFLVGLVWKRKKVFEFIKTRKEEVLFIAGWYLTLFVMFVSGNINRTRYLLPAYPLMAALFSSLAFYLLRESGFGTFMRGIQKVFLIIVAAAACLFIFTGAFVDMRILAGGLWLLIISAIIWFLSLKKNSLPIILALGLYMMFVITAVDTFVRPVFRVSPVLQLAQRISSVEGPIPTIISIGMGDKYAGQLRVAAGGRIKVVSLPEGSLPPHVEDNRILILTEKSKEKFDPSDYKIERCGYSFKPLKASHFLNIIKGEDRDEVFEKMKRDYYLAFKVD